jgi:hypothetical protein
MTIERQPSGLRQFLQRLPFVALIAGIICAIAIAVLTLIGPPGNLTVNNIDAIRRATEAAQQRWNEKGSTNYDIDLSFEGSFCMGLRTVDWRRPVTLHVRSSRIASVDGRDRPESMGCPPTASFESVLPPKVFDSVLGMLNPNDSCMNFLEVTYDELYGYASKIQRGSTQCSDSGLYYEFSNFRPG